MKEAAVPSARHREREASTSFLIRQIRRDSWSTSCVFPRVWIPSLFDNPDVGRGFVAGWDLNQRIAKDVEEFAR